MSYICEIGGLTHTQIPIGMSDIKLIVESMDEEQLEELKGIIKDETKPQPTKDYHYIKGTLENKMKEDLWNNAKKKYSLEDLEKLLGTEYDLL
jgi:hypothetical protein